jgi:hypothetical protein
MRRFYIVLGLAIIGLYCVSVHGGWEFPTGKRTVAGPDMRSASGGNVFIYSHYRGGK